MESENWEIYFDLDLFETYVKFDLEVHFQEKVQFAIKLLA